MPNPDDLLDTPTSQQPNLRERIGAAEPARQAGADALRSRMAPKAPAQPPIAVNAQGQAAAPGNLRDKISIGSAAQQADARAVSARMQPPTLTDVIEPGTPPQAAPAQPGLRESLQARASAAPGAAERAMRQRMGGGIAQAAQQAVGQPPALPAPATGSTFAPGATSTPSNATVFAGGDGAPAARNTLPVPARPQPGGNVVPAGPGARVPLRPGAVPEMDITPSASGPAPGSARGVVPVTPGAKPPSSARGVVPAGPGAAPPPEPPAKAPYSKPSPPPVRPGVSTVNGAGQATVPNPGMRDKLTVGANQAQADLKAAADRMAAHPTNVGPKNPNVASLRQSVGLHPVPPGAAGAEPGLIGKYASKVLGTGEDWAALGAKLKPAGMKLLKASGALAIGDGAYNAYEGVRQGDLSRAAWGVGDAIAGVASFTPAKGIAAAYLGARGAYELGHAVHDGFGSGKKPAAAAAAKPAAAPAAAPAPAAKPAAAPAAAPASTAAAPAAAPVQQPRVDQSSLLRAAREEALGAIDNEEAASPNAAYYQTTDQRDNSVTYETRDGKQIRVQQPTDRDRKLAERISVIDGRPEAGPTFEHEGKVYKNVVTGQDEVGKPIVRAISVDGAANTSTQVNDASLIRDYDEAQARLAGPSAGDQERISAFQGRQQERDVTEQRYQQMLSALQGNGEAPANAGPVADAARASGGGNANVAAFVQQYGEAAKAAGDKLGVDPNLLLTQWGHETGWGKSVIPGTNNLGNIKAVKGQAGVAATDNMTGSRDQYAQYASPHEFADQYVNLVNSRYPGAVGAGSDMGKFAGALKAGGYAEDPAYVDKLQAAYKTVLGANGGAPAQAAPSRFAPDPLAGGVQVIDMNSGNVSVTWPGMGSVHDGMTMDGYRAYQSALQKNPQLADRIQMTERGPSVDGIYMPANVLAGGDGAMAKYARNYEQSQRFAVNPVAGKIAEEAVRGEVNNAGHQIQAGATRYTADKHLEAAKVGADTGNKRYIHLKGGVNPETYTPEADKLYDTQTQQYVQQPGAGAAPQKGQPAIPPAAIEMLRKQPQTAAQFDAQFGAGASRRYLQGN